VLLGKLINKGIKTSTKKTNNRCNRTKPEHQQQGDIIAVQQRNHY